MAYYCDVCDGSGKLLDKVCPLCDGFDMEDEKLETTFTLTVMTLNGDEILRVEIGANEKVGALQKMVQDALCNNMLLVGWMLVDGKQLLKHTSIEQSGLIDGSTVVAYIMPKPAPKSNVLSIITETESQVRRETARLKADGSMEFAHSINDGKFCVLPLDASCSRTVREQLAEDVQSIFATDKAFAALKVDGCVVSWGYALQNSTDTRSNYRRVRRQLENVRSIYTTRGAFAALKCDASVVAWGTGSGGDCSEVQEQLAANVLSIYSNQSAFAALKADGNLVTWGVGAEKIRTETAAWISPTED